MNGTPKSNKTHISIFGDRNVGKSSLFNSIIGQNISIVCNQKGTTTDPVSKSMELIPYGPVHIIDTAGLDDNGILGNLRVEKTKQILLRTDFALYVLDASSREYDSFFEIKDAFTKYRIPYILVINKTDLISQEQLDLLKNKFEEAVFISTFNTSDILNLKNTLIARLSNLEQDFSIVGDLLPYDSSIILVLPIDSEAPKGRLILPQVQIIRDCLDNGIKSYVVRDTELENALKDLKKVDLVITDSQAFKHVNKIVPPHIPLTSFSILFARHKGDLASFLDGCTILDNLHDGDKILITESCTHNTSHEDIGRVKIPNLIRNYSKKNLYFDFAMGHDFPNDLEKYKLVIHCGACMLNPKTLNNRIMFCKESHVPITNYGMVIAKVTGILERSIEIFNKNNTL